MGVYLRSEKQGRIGGLIVCCVLQLSHLTAPQLACLSQHFTLHAILSLSFSLSLFLSTPSQLSCRYLLSAVLTV